MTRPEHTNLIALSSVLPFRRNAYNAMPEDYHEELPAHDPAWGWMQLGCLVVVWGCAFIAGAYVIAWGVL